MRLSRSRLFVQGALPGRPDRREREVDPAPRIRPFEDLEAGFLGDDPGREDRLERVVPARRRIDAGRVQVAEGRGVLRFKLDQETRRGLGKEAVYDVEGISPRVELRFSATPIRFRSGTSGGGDG